MISIYRISDFTQNNTNKPKIPEATKQACLQNFIREFGTEHLYIIADSVSDENYEWLTSVVPKEKIIRTSYKSGAYSFMHGVNIVRKSGLPADTVVYFVEDDYIHRPMSKEVLLEGLTIADYVTLYDHPDKYEQLCGIYKGRQMGDISITENSHWRSVPSTTMTFATTVKTLTEDISLYHQFCKSGYPYDNGLFHILGKKGRKLVSPMPSMSTHCELKWLAPLAGRKEWKDELKE